MSAGAAAAALPGSQRAFLTLRAQDRTFALPIEFARSSFRIESLTRVPLAPAHLIGLTNLRGAIVAVVCLTRRLALAAGASGAGALAVGIEAGGETFALVVQDIGEIIHACPEDASPLSNGEDSPHPAATAGLVRSGAMSAPILDPLAILDFRSRT